MDPSRFVELAREMVIRVTNNQGRPTAEAEGRSAVSRAYYAAFHVALDYLGAIGIEAPKDGKCHTLVRHGLNNSGDSDLISISGHLGTLYTSRRRADYELGDLRIAANADPMTSLAEKTIASLKIQQHSLNADASKRAAIAATILGWAKTAGQDLRPKR